MLTTSPGQLGKHELRLAPPKETFLITKLWAFLSAPLDGTECNTPKFLFQRLKPACDVMIWGRFLL